MKTIQSMMIPIITMLFSACASVQTNEGTEGILEAQSVGLTYTLKRPPLLSLSFEANYGQTDPQVKYLSRGNDCTLYLTSTQAVLTLSKATNPSSQDRKRTVLSIEKQSEVRADSAPTVLQMKLLGANPNPKVLGLDKLSGTSNYFITNDPKKWHTNVPHYTKVKYEDVYSKIDLVYYHTNKGQLEYDFIIAPGADPQAITINLEGAEMIEVDRQGNLLLHLSDGRVYFHKPLVYQTIDGIRQKIAGSYVLKDKHRVGFQLGAYDSARYLVIDPLLVYSTYLGGSGGERGEGIAVDATGNAFVTGSTRSINFPTEDPLQDALAGSEDAFVTKLNPAGDALVYSTYLGGSGNETGFDISVDVAGNAYVTGTTTSIDLPVTENAFQNSARGSFDSFVVKLNPTGDALVYSTYLGGNNQDLGFGITIDSASNAYIAGRTGSVDFPVTPDGVQVTFGGGGIFGNDGFVTKLNPTGSSLVYSTYLGGSADDQSTDIAVDAAGNSYVIGNTESINFPTKNPLQPSLGGGSDAFVTKLNPAGDALVYSTYFGGSPIMASGFVENGLGIAVDGAGNAYLTGVTRSTNFPTVNPVQPTFGGGVNDAFVAKVNGSGSTIFYSTYLGGSGRDLGSDIAVDAAGNAYVIGRTESINFPTKDPLQDALAGSEDTFVTKFNPAGVALVYSTYLGGSGLGIGQEVGNAIAADAIGNAHVSGSTRSTDFPTADPFQPIFGGGSGDAFVAKIGPAVIAVAIDVKPSNPTNSINPSSKGVIAVVVLTSEDFYALEVDPDTVRFGPTDAAKAHTRAHIEDVDYDGDMDLLFHFRTQETGIQCGDTEATLTGDTWGGIAISGTDSINTIGCR